MKWGNFIQRPFFPAMQWHTSKFLLSRQAEKQFITLIPSDTFHKQFIHWFVFAMSHSCSYIIKRKSLADCISWQSFCMSVLHNSPPQKYTSIFISLGKHNCFVFCWLSIHFYSCVWATLIIMLGYSYMSMFMLLFKQYKWPQCTCM